VAGEPERLAFFGYLAQRVQKRLPDTFQGQVETGVNPAAEGVVDQHGIRVGQPVLEFLWFGAAKRDQHDAVVCRHK